MTWNRKVGDIDLDNLIASKGFYKREEIDNFDYIYRFGKYDIYNALQGNTKEYVFFTKPDLHILDNGVLQPEIQSEPFFIELYDKWYKIIPELQKSVNTDNGPFNLLLSNTIKSTLEVPSLSSSTIDNPVNLWGTSYEYRGTSEASNDNFEFSIEFNDNKYLDTYMYFKTYEYYEMLKAHGKISPNHKYIFNKEIHDQIAIYKFMVDQDSETILYYAKYWGVMFKSLPRDVFSDNNFEEGLSYSIDCKAAFFDDNDPLILSDFNELSKSHRQSHGAFYVPVYDMTEGIINPKRCRSAYISKSSPDSNGRRRYKLKFVSW